MGRPSCVIVGANMAGNRAAETIRKLGFDGRVVLVGDERLRPYQRPPLSKEFLRGETPRDRLHLRPEDWYADHDVELRLGARVTSIDPSDRVVVLAGDERVPYERLLLATGARPRRLSVPGADAPGVMYLRTADDAEAIGAVARTGAPIVVIGAGFIGAEVAASARMLGCEVTLLEIAEVPMERALGREIGSIYARIHRDRGVDLRTGTGVSRIDPGSAGLRVVTTDGQGIDAAAVVVGVGVAPNVELAERAGLSVSNGIVVDASLETSVPGIFAAGDVARAPNAALGHPVRVEHQQNAQNQGEVAARAMLGSGEVFDDVPWFWSDQYDLTLQMAGLPLAWDRVVVRGDVEGLSFAAFFVYEGVVVAALGVNRARDVRASRRLIAGRTKVTPDDLANEEEDLVALAEVPV